MIMVGMDSIISNMNIQHSDEKCGFFMFCAKLGGGGVQLNLTQFKITIFKLSLGNSWVKIE